MSDQQTTLGPDGPKIVPMGIGTWAWGDSLYWDYNSGDYTDSDLHEAFTASLEAGITLFDTAELYGNGNSERILGRFVKETDMPALVATKWFPYPWRFFAKQSIPATLQESLERLDLPAVDLYQVHWPFHTAAIATVMEGMAIAVKRGLTTYIGVSNYDLWQTRRASLVLRSEYGLNLTSNQVKYSLIDRSIEKNGLLSYCLDNGITLIAYSPLEQGMLTGKYTPANPPSGTRRARYGKSYLKQLQPLIALLEEIGRAHGGKTAAQVALNWVIAKGAVPIPGAKNLRQAQDNLGALGWLLTPEEVSALDKATDAFN